MAPILSNIYLAQVDREINKQLNGLAMRIFRYVDDFLVLVEKDNFSRTMVDFLKLFRECAKGLSFTFELPCNDALQFLSLKLFFKNDHLCWKYSPRSQKPVLNYSSGHSKTVKNGIATSCIRSSLQNSCHHCIQDSVLSQVHRLRSAGFPETVISATCEKLLRMVRADFVNPKREKAYKKVAVIPYVHRIAHNLKNVAGRFDVDVAFSAPCKLSRLCRAIRNRHEKAKKL